MSLAPQILLHSYIGCLDSSIPGIWYFFVLFAMLSWFSRMLSENKRNEPKRKLKVSDGEDRVLKLESELARLRKVFHGTAALNATLNYERALDMALDLATSAIHDSDVENGGLVSTISLFNGNQLQMVTARGLMHADLRIPILGHRGIVEEALSSGRLQITNDPTSDPELGRIVAMQRCTIAICIPLVVGLEVYGMMLFAHPHQTFLSEEGLELLEAIAQQVIVALQNAKLYRDLEQEKERMAEIQEGARNKLARDLHDGPAQSIGAIAMRVNFARRLVSRDPNAASDELYNIEELARRTSKEIRQMLFTLRPLILESEGLIPALEDLAEKMNENHKQNVVIEADNSAIEDMEVGKQGVVFFIVEEALNNARKHAKAKHIWVRLDRKGELANLIVEDDGIGFDLRAIEDNYDQRGSLGMVNLRERAEMVNGILNIRSQPGSGTRIQVTIPMTVEAAERLHRPGFGG
jgi:signal transduction histidine kinase